MEDVAEANCPAIDRADGEILNIGCGVETNVLEIREFVLAAIRDTKGLPFEEMQPVFEAPRLGELTRVALDARRAISVLGWQPRTPLAEGIARTVAFCIQAVSQSNGQGTPCV